MFDPKLLEQAISEVSKDLLMKEIREWFVMTAPPNVNRIYGHYQKLKEKQMCECGGTHDQSVEQLRPFNKVLTVGSKERLKSIADEIREGNKKLSIFISEMEDPEVFLLSSIYEAIEDELSTLDSCTNS
jgi:hypothetical protein